MATYTMIPVEEAATTILAHTASLPAESQPTAAAYGRVLATEVRAAHPMPPFDASTVDGYAVLAGDSQPRRRLLAIVTAGKPVDAAVETGTAIRIMTGAPLPRGADAVIMQEFTREDDGHVVLERGVRPGENINRLGADIADDEVILAPGHCPRPGRAGAAG